MQNAVEQAKHELAKVFQLAVNKGNITMPSRFIDKVWHDMLKDNDDYEKFCMKNCGRKILHDPDQGEGEIDWIEKYSQNFGKLNHLWFYDESGVFDQDKYETYMKTGKLYASWDCVVLPTEPPE